MERADAQELVAVELTHIPSWPGEHQGLLRAVYRLLRGNSIGIKRAGSAGEVLVRCTAIILRDFPTATFEYDRAFFNG